MVRYKIVLMRAAFEDLRSIYSHIAHNLNEPVTAERIHKLIVTEIKSLDVFPLRNKLLEDEPYHSMGLRMFKVKNYSVFYTVNEDEHVINVLRVLYARRDWQNII